MPDPNVTIGAAGSFERQASVFREQLEHAEPGRYHLYVAAACPWCHRTMIVRELLGLQEAVGISYLDPIRDERGWAFTGGRFVDQIEGMSFLAEAYVRTDPRAGGRITAPVLWDREAGRIVNNESSDIIRMFETGVFGGEGPELYPAAVAAEIDAVNERVYETVNNGVYRCGFASSQVAYEAAFAPLFETLDSLEQRLAGNRYLLGEQVTEADWRLFPTLVRFDAVYYSHFKCNLRRIVDYPNLWGYTRELYQLPGVAATVELDEIKRHYYGTHRSINPSGIVPLGPAIDFEQPHGRG
ncbi:MAG TPA: glutathione S-transferase family protein [Solirubrobacteraceae bacterium]|nr:glutathione S-transferase family protein [Solirubrobacteraceae bacterium]